MIDDLHWRVSLLTKFRTDKLKVSSVSSPIFAFALRLKSREFRSAVLTNLTKVCGLLSAEIQCDRINIDETSEFQK